MRVIGKLCINKRFFFLKEIPCTFSQSSLALIAGNIAPNGSAPIGLPQSNTVKDVFVWSKCDVVSQKTIPAACFKLPYTLFITDVTAAQTKSEELFPICCSCISASDDSAYLVIARPVTSLGHQGWQKVF